MTPSGTSIVLSALILVSAMTSGCRPARRPDPAPLVRSDSNVEVESPPPVHQFPKPNGFVNDFAAIVTATEEENLESVLRRLRERGKIDFAIVIVKSTGSRDIFDYSLAMANEWKVSSENGGILLLVSIEDRKWGIQIDKKLEKKFTNEEIKRLGDLMVPHFREQNYNAGLRVCVKAIADELARRHDFEPVNF